MAGYEMVGTVIHVGELEHKSATFSVQEFVVDDGHEKYPQKVKFQVMGKALKYLEQNILGMKVNVHFNVRGREYNGNYYTNLQAWKIETIRQAPAKTPDPMHNVPPATTQDATDEEEVPF